MSPLMKCFFWTMTQPKEMRSGLASSINASHKLPQVERGDLIEDSLRQADNEYWLELMRREDVAAGPVNTLDQAVNDQQVIHNQAIVTMNHPDLGEVKGIECPIKVSGVESDDHLPPPTLGQHTEEVLESILGYSKEKTRALRREQEEVWNSRSRGEGRF